MSLLLSMLSSNEKITKKTMKQKKEIRKLTKVGGGRSMSLILPIDYVRQLGWRERQKLVVRMQGKSLVIKDWKK